MVSWYTKWILWINCTEVFRFANLWGQALKGGSAYLLFNIFISCISPQSIFTGPVNLSTTTWQVSQPLGYYGCL